MSFRPALWLSMPSGVDPSSGSSNTAATIIKTISTGSVSVQPQVIFHLRRLPPYGTPLKDVVHHEVGVISMLYHSSSKWCMAFHRRSPSRRTFGRHASNNLMTPISLCGDLLSLSLPYLCCIVSDFETLDYDDGVKPCQEFALELREVMASCDAQNHVLKTLFVTAGGAQSWSSSMQEKEVHHEREPARRRQKYHGGPGSVGMSSFFV